MEEFSFLGELDCKYYDEQAYDNWKSSAFLVNWTVNIKRVHSF